MTFGPNMPISLRILSQPAHLPVVRAAVEKTCELLGFDTQTTGGVVLSVDEALANIIKHAYKSCQGKPIEIELAVEDVPPGPLLRIRLRDYGCHVDPSLIRSRDLHDIRPGGLGVHIMKNCMDSVEYQGAEGGGTLLTMTKSLPVSDKRG